MGVIAIIAALLIEQWRPLGDRKSVNAVLGAWAGWLEQSFNGGERRHGTIAWLVAAVPAAVAGAALHAVLYALPPLLALAFNIAALYVTLGFRQFSHHFTAIQLAIKSGEIERARLLLDEWRGASGVVRTREADDLLARGGAARFPPPRVRRAAVVRAAARAERRDPV